MAGGLKDSARAFAHDHPAGKSSPGDIRGRDWCGHDLRHKDLRGADLCGVCLVDADLRGAALTGARLDGADLSRANLSDADLRQLSMSPAGSLEGANLRRSKLQGADLFAVDLGGARLAEADLTGANLTSSNLRDAELSGATLKGADLSEADLTNASLRNADLRDAKLIGVKGLGSEQLAGADLSGANLPPDVARFEGLAHVSETANIARTIFLVILLGCAYALLTIWATTDLQLLTNAATSPLPIVGSEVEIVFFYWVAPLILFGFYAYFHLYLPNMWRSLAALPARFPDGKALDERAHPWLLCGLVRAHFPKLRAPGQSFLSMTQRCASVALAWGVVPVTLLVFWLRYLPAQELGLTLLHISLFSFSVAVGVLAYRLAVATLRDGSGHGNRRTSLWPLLIFGLGFLVLLDLSRPAIQVPFGPISSLFAPEPSDCPTLGLYRTCVDLTGLEVSSVPAGWDSDGDNEDLIGQVRGEALDRRNLRAAQASEAFLVRADLRHSDVSGAFLEDADMRATLLNEAVLHGAYLVAADLRMANLSNAKLDHADLQGAKLEKAFMNESTSLRGANLRLVVGLQDVVGVNLADLRDVNLSGTLLSDIELVNVKLAGADLRRANLMSAYLSDASLPGADLIEADLTGAYLTGADLSEADLSAAKLKKADLRESDLSGAMLLFTKLTKADVEKANFEGADLLGADLSRVNLSGAMGLTQEQVVRACGIGTIVPPGLESPPPCPGPILHP